MAMRGRLSGNRRALLPRTTRPWRCSIGRDACRPACWRRLLLPRLPKARADFDLPGGKPGGLRRKTGPSPRVAAGVSRPADPARQGAGRIQSILARGSKGCLSANNGQDSSVGRNQNPQKDPQWAQPAIWAACHFTSLPRWQTPGVISIPEEVVSGLWRRRTTAVAVQDVDAESGVTSRMGSAKICGRLRV